MRLAWLGLLIAPFLATAADIRAARDRQDKTSFAPLMDYGLRQRRRAFVESLLKDGELARRNLVVERKWQQSVRDYLDGKGVLYWNFWYGIILETWLRHLSHRLPPLDPVDPSAR